MIGKTHNSKNVIKEKNYLYIYLYTCNKRNILNAHLKFINLSTINI